MKAFMCLLGILAMIVLLLSCSNNNENEVGIAVEKTAEEQTELTPAQQELQDTKVKYFVKSWENQEIIPEFVEMIPYLNKMESYDKTFFTLYYTRALLQKYDSTATKEDSLDVESLKKSIKLVSELDINDTE